MRASNSTAPRACLPRGLELSYGNCQGWAQMQCCLKGFLEYGINLRKGAY